MRFLFVLSLFFVLCVGGYAVALHIVDIFHMPDPMGDTMMILVGAASLVLAQRIRVSFLLGGTPPTS